MRQRSSGSRHHHERGVAVMQFALAIPVLMLMTIALIDLARLLAIEGLLNKGAEDGLNLAIKITELDIDVRGRALSDPEYQSYFEARRRVLEAATRLPLSTLVTDTSTPSGAQLIPFTMSDPGLNLSLGETAPTITRGAALLRPGERALNGNSGQWMGHRIVPPDNLGNPPPQTSETLLQYYPIQVELYARVQTFLPLLGTKIVRGSALGYREANIPRGPLPYFAGGTTLTTVTTTSTTSTVTSTMSTTTSTALACGALWNLYFVNTIGPPGSSPQCPDSNCIMTSCQLVASPPG